MTDERERESIVSEGVAKIGRLERNLPKRFYTKAGITRNDTGFGIELDGRAVKTPLKRLLSVPNEPLADAITVEWEAQVDVIDPLTMPLTKHANSAIDRIEVRKDAVVDELAAFGASDLVCYRADSPDKLVARQAQHWDGVVKSMETRLGARFILVQGVMFQAQPPETLDLLKGQIAAHDAFTLAALHTITNLTGSVLIALALVDGDLSEQAGWAAAHVDEDWQIEQWGSDEEAQKRRVTRLEEYSAALKFTRLLT